ncbi:uncharacterized protein EDB91DRAFT_1087876 [Suillus paluster]|uniref:uncharacterized protein n=1 Tax=Suillus paluster TaxID=48578 RepID=UPI001B863EDA|nr:uncharacterized protein EDB91DRAFT_1087876 [Suillus paluster]KAG1723251.1 hypothetical protein EDB91DRAFT_1087876 [Suillus paluster]
MTSAGEKQHYSLALVKQLFNHLPPDMMVGLLYDIGCQLEHSCRKWSLLDDSILSRIIFGVSMFHVYGHQWPCQILYHPQKCAGFGLSDGEGLSPAVVCTGCTSALLGPQVPQHIGAMAGSEVDALPEEEKGGSKYKAAEAIAGVLALEKTLESHQSIVAETHVRRRAGLGISENADLQKLKKNVYLQVRMNAHALKIRLQDRLQQRKFELEKLERLYRNTVNELNLHSHTETSIKWPLLVLFYPNISHAIDWRMRLQTHLDGFLMKMFARVSVLYLTLTAVWKRREYMIMEWTALQRAREVANVDVAWHLERRATELSLISVEWQSRVRPIPCAWGMPDSWGPSAMDMARAAHSLYHVKTVHATNSDLLELSEDEGEDSD